MIPTTQHSRKGRKAKYIQMMHLILEAECSKKPLEPMLTQNNNTWYNLEGLFFLIA